MLEFMLQSIACDIPASQELWNAPSQVCIIAACGWAYKLVADEFTGAGGHTGDQPSVFQNPISVWCIGNGTLKLT